MESLLRYLAVLVYVPAAFCVFLALLSRVFILVPDNRFKTPAILTTLVVLIGAGVVSGVLVPRPPWIYIPLAILGLVLLGEGRRILIRRACAGSLPSGAIPHQVDLTAPITTTDLVVHRYRVTHPAWRGTPMRIAHLTDLHVHRALPLEYYQNVISLAEQEAPDIAVFTGDFITHLEALPKLKAVLRPIGTRATYAVLGNHDYWADPDAVGSVIADNGLHLLSNETTLLTVGPNRVAVTGYDYPWGTREKHLPSPAEDALHVVLSHTPDNIYRISAASADLVFSGHYHAGQIRVPVLGPVVIPSVYGRRFDHGHFIVNGTHLFVASGVGAANPPLRVYCQPDIFIVDIVAGHHSCDPAPGAQHRAAVTMGEGAMTSG